MARKCIKINLYPQNLDLSFTCYKHFWCKDNWMQPLCVQTPQDYLRFNIWRPNIAIAFLAPKAWSFGNFYDHIARIYCTSIFDWKRIEDFRCLIGWDATMILPELPNLALLGQLIPWIVGSQITTAFLVLISEPTTFFATSCEPGLIDFGKFYKELTRLRFSSCLLMKATLISSQARGWT